MRKSHISLVIGMVLASQSAFAVSDLRTQCAALGGRFENQQRIEHANYAVGVNNTQEAMQVRLVGSSAWYFAYDYNRFTLSALERSYEKGSPIDICIRPTDNFIFGVQRSP